MSSGLDGVANLTHTFHMNDNLSRQLIRMIDAIKTDQREHAKSLNSLSRDISEIAENQRIGFNRISQFALALFELRQILITVQKSVDDLKPKPVPSAATIKIYQTINGQEMEITEMEILTGAQQRKLTLSIKDAQGNAAVVDGLPSWSVTDGALASLVVADDAMSAILSSAGGIGLFKVQVHADADMGAGVIDLLGEAEFEVISSQATILELVSEPVV